MYFTEMFLEINDGIECEIHMERFKYKTASPL
jgi:hypothetical protein